MAARDKRRTDIARFLETIRGMRVPPGDSNQQSVWVILAHHGTKDGATNACAALWKRYTSVNEFRVAKVAEVAGLIGPYVKNDPLVAVAQARGFLRRYFTEFQMVNPTATDSMTPDQLKKQLSALDTFGREIALALALYYCQQEADLEAEPAPAESDAEADKPKKRPEKDLTLAANRLRLLFAFSAYGTVTLKSMQANASRAFAKSWAFKSVPKPRPAPKPKPAPIPTPAPRPAPKAAPKAPAKKVAKKTPAKKKVGKVAAKKESPAKKAAKKRTARKR